MAASTHVCWIINVPKLDGVPNTRWVFSSKKFECRMQYILETWTLKRAYAWSLMLLKPLCISIALFENMNFHPLFLCSIFLKAILFMYVMIWIVNKPSFRIYDLVFHGLTRLFANTPPPPQVLFLKISKISQVFGKYFFQSNFYNFWYPKCKKSKSH